MNVFFGRTKDGDLLEIHKCKARHEYFGDIQRGDYAFIRFADDGPYLTRLWKFNKFENIEGTEYACFDNVFTFNRISIQEFASLKLFKINTNSVVFTSRQAKSLGFFKMELVNDDDFLNNIRNVDVFNNYITDENNFRLIEFVSDKNVNHSDKNVQLYENGNFFDLLNSDMDFMHELSNEFNRNRYNDFLNFLKNYPDIASNNKKYKSQKKVRRWLENNGTSEKISLLNLWDFFCSKQEFRNDEKDIEAESDSSDDEEIESQYESDENEMKNNRFVHNLLYFGAPGTGKSFAVKKELKTIISSNEAKIIINEKEHKYYERVTFRADSTYGNFIGAYKPVPLSGLSQGITYKFVPGPFMRLYVEAWKNPKKNYVLLIEELNRAEAAAVFGDVFQLLDRYNDGFSEYDITTTEELKKFISLAGINANNLSELKEEYSKNHSGEFIDVDSIANGEIMILPPNLYIRATMNSADQGVFPIDTAFKRRWSTCYLQVDDGEMSVPKTAIIEVAGKQVGWNDLRKAINNILKRKVNEDKLMGPFFIKMSEMSSVEACTYAFKNKVLDYLVNDAAKMTIKDVFEIENNRVLLSDLLNDFETIGFDIFSQDILNGVNVINLNIEESINVNSVEEYDDMDNTTSLEENKL